jgi:hypothetical protein
MAHGFCTWCHILDLYIRMVVLLKTKRIKEEKNVIINKIKQSGLSEIQIAFLLSLIEDKASGEQPVHKRIRRKKDA